MLGPEHPETLISMSDLAAVYERKGKYAPAEALDSQVLEVRRRVLGPEHPKTLTSMRDLAADLRTRGQVCARPRRSTARFSRFSAAS